jgi:hypothetical protein
LRKQKGIPGGILRTVRGLHCRNWTCPRFIKASFGFNEGFIKSVGRADYALGYVNVRGTQEHRMRRPNGESNMRILVLAAAFVLFCFSQARADIRITEVMSSSGTGGTNDWFEVTNFSGSAINLAGWRMDDNSFLIGNSVELLGVTTIGAGESVVFIENTADATTTMNGFKSFWFGSSVPTGFQVGYYNGSGAGVSLSSAGDGVALFNGPSPTGTEVFRVTFGAATTGRSFDNYLGNPGAITTISQVGVNGAFQSNNALANVGSPGAVPEPSALGLFAVAGVVAGGFRRKRS